MNVLWEFMGVSQPYTFFSGTAEVLGSLLLLFRRTTTLGAIVCCGVMLQVVVLNLCYDVGVKLYSIHLLLMAVFLLLPDVKPLIRLLVFRQEATLASLSAPRFESRLGRVGSQAMWALFVGYVLYTNVGNGWSYYKQAYLTPQHSPLNGLFDVESFVRNGQEVPPITTEITRWQKMSIDRAWTEKGDGYVHVRTMEDRPNQLTRFQFRLKYDMAKSTIILVGRNRAGAVRNTFTYSLPDADHVLLDGNIDKDAVSMRLRKIDVSQYLLAKRHFRWVQPNLLGRPDWSLIR